MSSMNPTEESHQTESLNDARDVEKVEAAPEAEGETLTASTVAPRPKPVVWGLVCVGLYTGAMLYGLDTTIAADVQGSVYEDLGHLEKLPWVGIGFPLGGVATILLLGRLFGTFEIKWLMIGSVILFEVGSAICGAAPTSDALIVGRVIAGIGGAGMYIGALSYVSIFTTLRERTIYNASMGLCWGVGAILGPVIGGGFSGSSATWRWAFYINLPLAAVTAPIYIFLFPKYNPHPDERTFRKLLRLDWVGAVLNAATFVLFVIALTFSGSTWAWGSSDSIALWVVFGVCLACYITQQAFAIFTTTERRLFPVHFLRSRTLVLMYIATATPATVLSVTLYYIPLYFQFTKGDDALEAAVRLLPFVTIYVFSVMFSGGLLPIHGRYTPWYFASSVMMIIGGVLMYRVKVTTSISAIYGYEVLLAIGSGIIFQIGYSVAAAKVAPRDVPASIGFINVAQIGTVSIALAISGALYQNLGHKNLKEALGSYDIPDAQLRSALAGALSTVLSTRGPVVRQLALDAIVKTISKLYALVFSAGAVTLVAACCMRWEKLKLDPTTGG